MKTFFLTIISLLFIVYSCKKDDTGIIEYPNISNYGTNILNESVTKIKMRDDSGVELNYSMSANLPSGTNLKVIMKGGLWYYRVMPNGPINWSISDYKNDEQIFTSIKSSKNCDLKISFLKPATISIEYYENNSVTPTRVKELLIE